MKTLQRQLTRFNKDVKKRVNIFKISMANLILWETINETPPLVDTSKALSNWLVNLHKAPHESYQCS